MTADDGRSDETGPRKSRGLSAVIYDPKIRGAFFQGTLIALGILTIILMISNVRDNLNDRSVAFDFADNRVECDADGDGEYEYVEGPDGEVLVGDDAAYRAGLQAEACDVRNFVYEQSGFSIQTSAGTYLMDYTSSRSSVLDVFFVGLINTIVVAALGIVSATLLGFVMGIFRLSSNVILRGFATVYVELFRNIPLILQMIVLFTLVGALLPTAREGSLELGGATLLDKGGLRAAFPEMLPGGGLVWIVAIGFGLLLWGLRRWSRARKDRTGRGFPAFWIAAAALVVVTPLAYVQAGYFAADGAAQWYEDDFGGRERVRDDPRFSDARARIGFPPDATVTGVLECPPIVEGGPPVRVALIDGLSVQGQDVTEIVLGRYHEDRTLLRDFDVASADCVTPDWIAPVQWELPLQGGLDGYFPGYGFIFPLSMFAVWLALTLYTGTFIAETVRAGVLAVNKGQSEAAGALGLRPAQARSLVIIPQAMRVIIPPLASQYLNLTKNSSLATVATYPDLVGIFGKTTLNQTGRAIEIVFITMLIYLMLSILISIFMNWYNKRIALVER